MEDKKIMSGRKRKLDSDEEDVVIKKKAGNQAVDMKLNQDNEELMKNDKSVSDHLDIQEKKKLNASGQIDKLDCMASPVPTKSKTHIDTPFPRSRPNFDFITSSCLADNVNDELDKLQSQSNTTYSKKNRKKSQQHNNSKIPTAEDQLNMMMKELKKIKREAKKDLKDIFSIQDNNYDESPTNSPIQPKESQNISLEEESPVDKKKPILSPVKSIPSPTKPKPSELKPKPSPAKSTPSPSPAKSTPPSAKPTQPPKKKRSIVKVVMVETNDDDDGELLADLLK